MFGCYGIGKRLGGGEGEIRERAEKDKREMWGRIRESGGEKGERRGR